MQLTLVLASTYIGSLLLFGIGFYFIASDFHEHVRRFLDYGSIRTLVGEFLYASSFIVHRGRACIKCLSDL